MNKVQLIGRLGQDPEGTNKYQRFSVATTDSYKNKAGEKVEETEWHNVVAFGKTGEIIAKYFKKGDPIYLEGKIKTSKKEGKYYTSIILEKFEFLPKGSDNKTFNSNVEPQNNDLPF